MLVGQIAKLLGCKTVGFTSSGKVAAAREFGYDHVIVYTGKDAKTLAKELRAVAPGRINGYFDNAGGVCTEAVMSCLAMNARVSVCGQSKLLRELSTRAPHSRAARVACHAPAV